MQEHASFMRRCFQLAEYGRGRVEPNPVVGSVVVCNGEIVSEGWHQAFGGPHAEVHAISGIPVEINKDSCTLYVNLEPCSHHGKTPLVQT
jgi:diaminohydroxyphosphoribosylaminopyrimidine deaminase / 5-amino-6-(5-phosphoribosylamino)uracil reductase